MASTAAGGVMVAGSVLFFVGAAVAVPRVFNEPDREKRLRMLRARPLAWRVGQPFYAVGALLAALGPGLVAADSDAGSRTSLAVSCGLLVLGGLGWCQSVYLRAVHPDDFALGRLAGWPFAAYVWLTLAGLVLLGVGLLLGDWPSWLAWLTLAADGVFLAGYVRYGDIPPFVFYLLLTTVGLGVILA